MRRALTTTIALACVLGVAACGGTGGDLPPAPSVGSEPPGGVPRNFWGVVSGTPLDGAQLDAMGRANVGTLRHLVLWPEIEPESDHYDWSKLDPIVAGAAENGIEMLPFVYGTPNWTVNDCLGLEPVPCQAIPPLATDGAKLAWQDFLHDLVSRYGPDGSFWTDDSDDYDPPYLPITRWQIWNEPGSLTFYRPQPSPEGYAELVHLAHDAITSVDPSAEVILAGLFRTPQKGQSHDGSPAQFLRGLYAVPGVTDWFDAVALHPYASNLRQIRTLFDKVLPIMSAAGDGDTPIWVSEIGWSSAPPEPNKPLLKGVEGQARLLTDSFELLRGMRDAWNLEGVVWYQWKDLPDPVEGCTFCQLSGLFSVDGRPKPAWQAFNRFTGGDAG